MIERLKQLSVEPSPQMDPLETQIYYAFGTCGNLTVGGKTLEQILLNVLEKRGLKNWWAPFQKNLLTESSLGAICDTLGKIGTKESLQVLTQLGKTLRSPLSHKVKEVLKKIEERTSGSTNE